MINCAPFGFCGLRACLGKDFERLDGKSCQKAGKASDRPGGSGAIGSARPRRGARLPVDRYASRVEVARSRFGLPMNKV